MPSLISFNDWNRYSMADSLTKMLDDFFTDSFPASRRLYTFTVYVCEDNKQYIVEAGMPGVKKEEIGLDSSDGRMTIGLQRNEQNETKSGNYIHKERRSSSVARSIYLTDAASKGIEAKLEDGVLKITVPRPQDRIEVK